MASSLKVYNYGLIENRGFDLIITSSPFPRYGAEHIFETAPQGVVTVSFDRASTPIV